ncbi:MAG TPA: Ig-like domain-containing protein, partial [Vicinamibacteria bacterium]|nr:Ig-like domain-containing protein [Vicinamibacteria bacterium]
MRGHETLAIDIFRNRLVLVVMTGFLLLTQTNAYPQERSRYLRLVHVIRSEEVGASRLTGPRVGVEVESLDPLNTAFDAKTGRWLALDGAAQQWVELATRPDGSIDPDSIRRSAAHALNLEEQARGITVDPESGTIFVLDGSRRRLVHVARPEDGSLEAALVSEIELGRHRFEGLRGLAFDSSSGHLHVWSAPEERLYEMSVSGEVVGYRDLSFLEINELESLSFAPSADSTDDPSRMNLYLSAARAGRGESDLIELSLVEPPPSPLADSTATLVQTIDTSSFIPPSPDPSGITYLGSTGRLLVSDGEVEEMPIYQGANVFDVALTGTLIDTFHTLAFSDEPTGVTINPNNLHLFLSDDTGPRSIYELDPGTDGLYGTPDDTVTSFKTSDFGSLDPEGVAYDTAAGVLFIVDGVNAEVYRVAPGANGVFDGVPPGGDDLVTSFDTASLGLTGPEGIEYDAENDALYLVGKPSNRLLHVTTAGGFLRTIDFSAANASNPAGVALAPGSQDSLATNAYIADRRVDNDTNPAENDGKIYELSLPPLPPGNVGPSVSAGPDQEVTLPYNAVLNGTVLDDGLPSPTVLTVTWSQASGPGLVNFLDAAASDTRARFFTAGTYVLRLTADDGEFSASDDMVVTVTGTDVSWVAESSVGASSDDAEEDGGAVTLASGDLEMGAVGGNPRTVGIRFNGLAIPQGSSILGAYIQFEADEMSLGASSILIEGEDTADALGFTTSPGNVSSRPRTGASVGWSPAPWTTVGEAGFDQRTPNIAPVLQEIVDGPGWSAGNSVALILTGSGVRTARSYDGSPAGAPRLHVDYVPPLANEMDLVLSNETVSDPRLYVACNTITAGTGFSVVAPGSVILRAGQMVILQNGFSVGSGANLTIQLDPSCTLNTAPSVDITSPKNISIFDEGESILFAGDALDAEEGDLSAGLSWFSDRDGPIGSGASLSAALSVGVHSIAAVISDSGGLSAQDSIVLRVNDVPTVTITAPANGTTFDVGENIVFTGTASDVEDGNLSAGLTWSSDIDGSIDSGPFISTATLSVGTHTITASVTDSDGGTGHASITVTVNAFPTVAIEAPADGSMFDEGESIAFTGTATDAEDGNLSTSLSWTSNLDGPIGTGGSFSTTALSAGQHTITAAVTDSDGASDQDSITLTVNALPVVTITSPVDGSTFDVGALIAFAGTAADAEDGDLTTSLSWTSNIDGAIGTGGSFSTTLSAGTHTITASVSDSQGAMGEDSITVTVNALPTVSITSPLNGSTFDENVSIDFTGTAGDAEDGDLTASLSWDSDLDGPIGTGGSFSTTLSAGTHTITASVTDSQGAMGEDSITVTVNALPTVTITLPADGSTFNEGEPIDFTGTATDAEDGDLTASLSWESDLDGSIGTGGSFSTTLSAGTHTITASVSDSQGASGEDTITVTVNALPTVSITLPLNGSTFNEGVSIEFSGTAADAEDGDLTASLNWTSDIDGVIGSGGGSFSTTLSAGTHTITASVTDSQGAMGEDSITVTVNALPTVSITSPLNGSTFDENVSIDFTGTAGDAEDGDLTASLSWDSDLDGPIGTGGSFSTTLSAGTHTITASVTDSQGAMGEDSITVTVNALPTVTISSPLDGSMFDENVSIDFTGTAGDTEDGDLTASLNWTSDIDGAIGSGGGPFSTTLSAGTHTITASVSDSQGAMGEDSITVTVNAVPTVTITSPLDGSMFDENVSIDFTGTAGDAEDGDLTASLSWESNLDGSIGTGGSFSTTLSAGTHTITASVSDSQGAMGEDSITVTVNAVPTVTITLPADGATFNEGESIDFTGTAGDAEDGDLTASLSWESDLDGSIGTGGSFSTTLSAGTHTITALVNDGQGASGEDTITVTVNALPTVSITLPLNGSTFNEGVSIEFSGTAA